MVSIMPGMEARGYGRVVSVASSAGLRGYAYVSAYCASKFALVGYSLALADELEGSGVHVNLVCPHYVDSPMLTESVQRLVAKTKMQESMAREFFKRSNPSGNLVTMDEVAGAVVLGYGQFVTVAVNTLILAFAVFMIVRAINTMKAKMAIKDVGRVLSVPLAKVNEIAKLVPDDIGITLEGALEKDPELAKIYNEDEDAKRIIDIGRKLEGSIRNTGIHAAGLIISGQPLTEHIPVCMSKDTDMPVTQFSMKPVEQVGMLKIDFLGLKTLTAIDHTVNAVRETRGIAIDWVNLPLDDQAAFEILNQGKTLGIFQLESGGMQDLARQLHLDKFEEIIAVGALYRPGPMDMIPSFINRKHGREEIEYDHDWMKSILSETYGIMVYQEQVMQIASKLANYSLGEGDVLRRAMGKKDHEEMTKQREKFVRGASENNIAGEWN